MSWADVKKEMVEVKNLDAEVADRIGEYVKLKGKLYLLPSLLFFGIVHKNTIGLKKEV